MRMSQKFHKSPTPEKSDKQPDFFSSSSVKPLDQFVSAVQFENLVPGFNDAKLRRLAIDLNPATRAPWIPKPVRGKYDLLATVAGVCAWLQAQATQRDGLPERYASYAEFEAQTRFPKSMMDYALTHGCKCRDDHGRISLTPFLEHFAPIFRKMFSGGGVAIKGVEGMEDLDLDFQRARVAKEDADERARENALANSLLHTRDGVKDELWENGLKDIAEHWKRADKSTGARLRKILQAAAVPEATIQAAVDEAVRALHEPITKLRALLPDKMK